MILYQYSLINGYLKETGNRLCSITFAFFYIFIAPPIFAQKETSSILRTQVEKELAGIVNSSSGVTGFSAVNLITAERFDIHADRVFAQASAIKIPIIMEVFQQAHQGKFKLTDQIWITPSKVAGGSGVLNQLTDSSSLSIRSLCTLMITLSDNTATNMLIDMVGMSNINQTLQNLGLRKTRVQRKMIQPASSARGEENISTPAEAARLMEILYKGEFINASVCKEIIAILKKGGKGTSRISTGIPQEVEVAYKPGDLPGVSTEWAIVYLEEQPYVITIMENYRVDSASDQTMEQLSRVVYEYFWRKANASPYGTYVDPALLKDTSKK